MSVALNENPAGTRTPEPSALKSFFSFENRFLAPLLITTILLVGELTFGMLESWGKLFIAIGTSVAVELALGRLITRKWPHLASAYITGISVGILIRSPLIWPYALVRDALRSCRSTSCGGTDAATCVEPHRISA